MISKGHTFNDKKRNKVKNSATAKNDKDEKDNRNKRVESRILSSKREKDSSAIVSETSYYK